MNGVYTISNHPYLEKVVFKKRSLPELHNLYILNNEELKYIEFESANVEDIDDSALANLDYIYIKGHTLY